MYHKYVKFADLSEKFNCTDEIRESVGNIITYGHFVDNKNGWCHQFGKKFADFCGAKYCVPLSNGSQALEILGSYYREDFKYAILPAYSFAATSMAFQRLGYECIYVDTTEDGLVESKRLVEIAKYIGRAVIVPVHLYGKKFIIPQELLDDSSYVIIEDSAQCHMKDIGTKNASAFSFYPAKNLGAYGEAGAIITDDIDIYHYASAISSYGDLPGKKYNHHYSGFNARMDEIQGAVLYHKLDKLHENNLIRIQVARQYKNLGISPISVGNTAYHLFSILTEVPSLFRDMLMTNGIESGNHYPYILPEIPRTSTLAMHGAKNFREVYPNAWKISRHVITLPIGPHLSESDVEYVSEIIHKNAELKDGLWSLK